MLRHAIQIQGDIACGFRGGRRSKPPPFLFVDTRLQMTAFCLASIAVELFYVVARLPHLKKRLMLNIGCVTLAMVATRWIVEALT